MAVTLKRVHRPSRLSVIVKSPAGSPITRWAQDEPNLENVFSGLTFSGEMPGGHKELSLTLHRDPKLSYRDLALFNRIEVWSSDGERVWCGTIRQEPTSDGDQQSIEVKAAGDMQFLEDDPTIVGPGFIDSDLSKWGAPSSAWILANKGINQGGESQLHPAGTDGESTPAAISHGSITETLAEDLEVTSWYDGGIPGALGAVFLDFMNVTGMGEGEAGHWSNVLGAGSNDEASEPLINFRGVSTNAQPIAVPPGMRYLEIWDRYGGTFEPGAPWKWQALWRNIRVIGNQGLTLQGIWPYVGFLAKQMIPFILEGCALTTDPELLEDDGFIIPQAWFNAPGTRMSKLIEVTKYGLLDWFVFGDRVLQYRKPGAYGRTWRLGPGNGPKNSGADANQIYDRFMVQWQDVDGTTKKIGIAGSGADFQDNRLLVTDERNPAVAADRPRGKLIALNGVCTPQLALEVGMRVKEELQNLSQSGEVTLTDHVQDEASGAWYPVGYVQPGDRVREQSNGHERKITSTSYADESVSNDLSIGAPPEGEKAIEERFNARLLELGLGG